MRARALFPAILLLSSAASLAVGGPASANVTAAGSDTREVAAAPARGSYVRLDPADVDFAEPVHENSHSSNLIYLNGCFNAGDCVMTPGFDDSVHNRSSILKKSWTIPAFGGGVVVWDAVVQCVKETYGPFNIEVTDENPGAASHFESITAGVPGNIGLPNGVGGVAPFACGVINNAISYSFADLYRGNVDQICWTVAQETAHAFGLDHEFLCEDPLTYLSSCGFSKRFMDVNAQCGENAARPCNCENRPTQNSYRHILEHFGPGKPTPPSVTITAPEEGAELKAGFPIRVNAVDDLAIARVEFSINNQVIDSVTSPPYVTNAPADLSDGRMKITAKAVDNYGFENTATVQAVQGAPCDSTSDCGDAETCVDGRCVPGPGAAGGLGEACADNESCASGLCADDGAGSKFCVEECELGEGGCPEGFGCAESGDRGVCWAGFDDGGGCALGGGSGPGSALLLLLGVGAAFLGRRRRV